MTEPTSRTEMKATLQGEPQKPAAAITRAEAYEIMEAVRAACRSRATARVAIRGLARGDVTQREKEEAWDEYRQDFMRVEVLLYNHVEGGLHGSAN